MHPINYQIELSQDPEFIKLVNSLEFDSVIETGTYHGDGSTLVFAKTGKPVTSIECNPENYEIAKKNLKDYPNVKLLLGYSLKKSEMRDFIENDDFYDSDVDIAIDGELGHHKEFYLNEIGDLDLPEDLLISLIDDSKQLILLDSAGGIGLLELKKLLSLGEAKMSNKILILDDINHYKHYRSIKLLQEKYKVYFSKNNRWGYTFFEPL